MEKSERLGESAGGTFPTTCWTLVRRAGADEAGRREALAGLLLQYLPALRAYLLSRGTPRDEADDLLQGFVADAVIERNLAAQADQARGKFRWFVLASLRHYVAGRRRHEAALRRSPGGGRAVVSLDAFGQDGGGEGASGGGDSVADPRGRAAVEAFELAWARQVMAEAVRRTRDECHASGRADVWDAFEGRLLAPALDGAEPVTYEALMARHGYATLKQAFNVLVTAKRAFDRALRAVVADYAEEGRDVDEELRDLRGALGRARRAATPRRD